MCEFVRTHVCISSQTFYVFMCVYDREGERTVGREREREGGGREIEGGGGGKRERGGGEREAYHSFSDLNCGLTQTQLWLS